MPNKKKNRVGESIVTPYGQKMTIIKYNNNNDLDVQFDDGSVVKNKKYDHFKRGNIKNPNNINPNNKQNSRIGEANVSNFGEKMTIVKYNSAKDITVEFEDGTITHSSYPKFKNGTIKNPNMYTRRLGEVNVSIYGEKMTIVKYNTSRNIDVEFEDGTVEVGKTYDAFKNGRIENPNHSIQANRVGEKGVSSCGQKMTIVKYKNGMDIDVQFEDGTVAVNKKYHNFKKGQIRHPYLSITKISVYKDIEAKYAWTEGDKVFYICKCRVCGEEGIWTPQEMIAHAEKHQKTKRINI